MTKRETYEQKTEQLLLPIMEEHQFELVDVEFVKEAGNWFLRAYIDKPGGIGVDDCETDQPYDCQICWMNRILLRKAYILGGKFPGTWKTAEERQRS